MRSGISEALMGIGGIFVAFGATVLVIAVFARRSPATRGELPTMMTLGTGAVVVGAVLFAAGYLLARTGRGSADSAEAQRRVA